ncbi:SpoIIE family protein phosphatase [Cryptosporangium japonicum]|uniref:GAF domain-containing protein n=1 Tax=Cryptosporangium japonicum TaxID=80872 RepID=A0ABN0TJG0_9ACTN
MTAGGTVTGENVQDLVTRLRLLAVACTQVESIDDLMGVALAQSAAGCDATGAVLFLRRGDALVNVGSCWLPEATEPRWGELRLEADLPLCVAVRTQRAVWVSTAAERRRRFPALAERSQGFVATASLPLRRGDHVLGVLGVAYRGPHEFTSAERLFLATLAQQVAEALVRLADAGQASEWQLSLQEPTRRAVIESLRPTAPTRRAHADRITALAGRLCAAPVAQLTLLGAQEVVVSTHGSAASVPSLKRSLTDVALREGAPLRISDATRDKRVAALPAVTSGAVHAYLGVPVRHGNLAIGTLSVSDTRPREWGDDHVDSLTLLAEVAVDVLAAPAANGDAAPNRGWAPRLVDFVADLAASDNATQVLQALVTAAVDTGGVDSAAAVYRSRAGAAAPTHASSGPHRRRWPVDESAARAVERRLTTSSVTRLCGADALLTAFPDQLPAIEASQVTDLIVVSLRRQGEQVGALLATVSDVLPLDGGADRFLSRLAALAGSALTRIVAQREQVEARARLAFLAEASLVLDANLDVDETLHRLARMAVPPVADACLVYLRGNGGLELVAVTHVDASIEAGLRAHAVHCPAIAGHLGSAFGSTDSQLIPAGCDCAAAPGVWRYGGGQVVALRARGRVLGAMWLASEQEQRIDGLFTSSLAQRAALALDNALLYRERRRAVIALQSRLLPPRLPRLVGFDLAAWYEVADASLDVGGDFYDVVPAADGSFTLVIGDVCGRGAEAASITGLARHTLRVLLEDGWAPAAALSRLNKALLSEAVPRRFCTVLLITMLPSEAGVEATIASGGHPLPLLLRRSGEVTEVGRPGHLLGVLPTVRNRETDLKLEPGDTIVLYTDGVSEARGTDGMFEDRLHAEVRARAGLPPGELVGGLRRAVTRYRQSGADDMAMLAIRVRGRELLHADLQLDGDPAARLDEALRAAHPDPTDVDQTPGLDRLLRASGLNNGFVGGDGTAEVVIEELPDAIRIEVVAPARDATPLAPAVPHILDGGGVHSSVAWAEVRHRDE